MRSQKPGEQALDPGLVRRSKAGQLRAVQIQHADQPPGLQQRHHQLAARRAVTSDMSGKAVHILNPLRLPSGCSQPAHAAAQGYPHTGHPALEWPQHQFIAAHQVETHPIEFAQLLEQQGAELCGVGNEVPLIGQQCL